MKTKIVQRWITLSGVEYHKIDGSAAKESKPVEPPSELLRTISTISNSVTQMPLRRFNPKSKIQTETRIGIALLGKK